jgi:hypothetical protein
VVSACENVGEPQSVLVMINPIISTHTPLLSAGAAMSLRPCHAAQAAEKSGAGGQGGPAGRRTQARTPRSHTHLAGDEAPLVGRREGRQRAQGRVERRAVGLPPRHLFTCGEGQQRACVPQSGELRPRTPVRCMCTPVSRLPPPSIRPLPWRWRLPRVRVEIMGSIILRTH